MAPRRVRRRSAWMVAAGLYVFAVAVNLVGIGWGLPGQGRGLLPPAAAGGIAETADRSWAAVQDPARNLNLGAPDPEQAETPARTLRRFTLYTADPDEVLTIIALARLNPFAGRWDPGITQYGGFFLYPLGAALQLGSAAGIITARGDPSFYMAHPEAMGRIFLAGRIVVVLVGALAIPLLWAIARPIYGSRVAALAAAIGAVAPAWIVYGHILKPWAFGAPFALAALAAGRRLIASARPGRDALLAGALAGLAAGAVLVYGPVILAVWIGITLRREGSAGRRLAWAAAAACAAAIVVLAVQPYWLRDPAQTLAAWRRILSWHAPDYRPAVLAAFVWGTLGCALGVPLAMAGLAEGAFQMWRSRESLPVLAPTFLMLLAAAVRTGEVPGDGIHARLIVPGALVLAMLGAGALWRLGRALPRFAQVLPLVLVIPTLLISGAVLRNFRAAAGIENTRHLAGRWLNAQPEGATIGVLAPLAPFRSPLFRMDRYRVVIEPRPDQGGAAAAPEFFLVAERTSIPETPAFQARYRVARRFAPPDPPLAQRALDLYPFADPPITVYARRPAPN